MFRVPRNIPKMAKKFINLEFAYVTPERYRDVVTHITNACAQGDPLNKKFCEAIKRGGDEFIEFFLFKTLGDKLSIMALNRDNKVVGVALNGITTPRDLNDMQYNIYSIQDDELRHLMQMQLDENLNHNIFDMYNIGKFFDLRLLSVDTKNCDGRIVGRQLVNLSETLAGNRNHKIIKSDATGDFSQKILTNCGFECLHQKDYLDYKDEDMGHPLKTIPDTKFQLLYKFIN